MLIPSTSNVRLIEYDCHWKKEYQSKYYVSQSLLYSHQPFFYIYMWTVSCKSKFDSSFMSRVQNALFDPQSVLTNKYKSEVNGNGNHLLYVNRIFISSYFLNQFIHERKVRVKAKICEIPYNRTAPPNCGYNTILTISIGQRNQRKTS